MAAPGAGFCEQLKRLGFRRECQMRLYGEEFQIVSDPIVVSENVVFVDAIEKTSDRPRRVRVPSTIINMLRADQKVA
jgi:hypothetical protein